MTRRALVAIPSLVLSSCAGKPSSPERINIVLISVDSLRADHVHTYG